MIYKLKKRVIEKRVIEKRVESVEGLNTILLWGKMMMMMKDKKSANSN